MAKSFLHATWIPTSTEPSDGNFFLWAEILDEKKDRKGYKTSLGGKPKSVNDLEHPFSADTHQIKNIISLSINKHENLKTAEFTLEIPSARQYPIPSPEISIFLEDNDPRKFKPESKSKIRMMQWTIHGITLKPSEILGTIIKISGTEEIILCEDFKYWQECAKFVLGLVAKQKFFPAMAKGSGKYYSVWKLVMEETDDIKIFNLLSNSMPLSCLSFKSSPQKISRPKDLLNHFMSSVADHTLRKWASRETGYFKHDLEEMTALEKWYTLLNHDNNLIEPFNRDVENLFKSFELWSMPLSASKQASPFRTCFRLEPPQDGNTNSKWTLRFLLQDTTDHSLIVEADEIWKQRGEASKFFKRKFQNPQERFLLDLGKASRLFQPIEKSLLNPKPSKCYLSLEDAYRFLKESSWLLKESGFSLLLPSWWGDGKSQKENSLGIKVKISSDNTGIFGLDSLINFDWQLAIGNEILSEDEFEKLVKMKLPLVDIRGKWTEIQKDSLQRTIEYLNKMKDKGITLGEAVRVGLGATHDELSLPVNGVEASGSLKDLFEGFKDFQKEKLGLIEPPKGFHGILRPYQQVGVSWMALLRKWGFGACLADDMGLGKTIQLIALVLHAKESGNPINPILLICPTSVIGNWCREISRFAPSLVALVHHGADRPKDVEDFVKEATSNDIVITSYSLSYRDEKLLSMVEWECIALDEAQNIKNHLSKQAITIRKLKSGFRIALTGTPIENRLSELWSIMNFLNPGYLGGHDTFRKNFSIPIERYDNKNASETLRRVVQPFVLRRVKTDKNVINDLPEKMESKVFCGLTKEQATLYKAVVESSLKKIEMAEGIERRGEILAALTKVKQVCNHPALFLGDGSKLENRSGKLERLKEMLEEVLAEGDRALVFTQFSKMGSVLKPYLQNAFGEEVLFLHGGTPRKARDEMIQRFQGNSQGPRIFVLSIKAGGFGLNLTNANHVFHFDRWWNPAVENQATDRAYRIGQKKNVQVHKFMCLGTVEERIDELIESKKELAENIVGAGESWITEMSTEDLREIFSLRKEFITE